MKEHSHPRRDRKDANELVSLLSDFVQRSAMDCCSIEFPVNSGKVCDVRISWTDSHPVDRPIDSTRPDRRGGDSGVVVQTQLRNAILEAVPNYGGVKAAVHRGKIVMCISYQHLVPDRRRRRR